MRLGDEHRIADRRREREPLVVRRGAAGDVVGPVREPAIRGQRGDPEARLDVRCREQTGRARHARLAQVGALLEPPPGRADDPKAHVRLAVDSDHVSAARTLCSSWSRRCRLASPCGPRSRAPTVSASVAT